MADQNILVRITGEADLTEAQVQMRSLNDRGKKLEKQMQQLVAAEKLQTAALEKMSRATADERAKAEESLKTTQKQIRETQAQINANQKNIQSLNQTMSSYNAMNGVSGKLAQRIKELREQMAQMEMAGDTSSQAFIEMGVEVAKLTDQIGDTQAQIRILASDTMNLDAAMSAGSGLVGGFNAATSAMALFGGESEELQQAFLKVQAAMAVLNGTQQVFNTFNKDSAMMVVLRTAYSKVFAKQVAKEAAATAASATASAADATAKGAETTATGAATAAQWNLNAAMAANPIGAIITLVVAAVAAIAALTYGIVKLVGAFSAEAKASRAAKKAQEEYEKQAKSTAYSLNIYAKEHEKTMNGIAERERAELNEKKKNHASKLEIEQAELAYLKERERATLEYQRIAVEANNKEQIKANEAFKAKEKQLATIKKGTKKYYEVLEELTQAERQMNEVWKRGQEITQELNDARQAVIDKEQQIADERLALQERLNASRINLIKDGQKREIAAIQANYKAQLKEISGNSKEEKALRASLLAEQAQEIEKVRRKYALQAKEAHVQELKNVLAEDTNNVQAQKNLAKAQAEYAIAQLDKNELGAKAYAAKRKAIEIQLTNDLKAIDDEQAKNAATVEQIKTETAIKFAKMRAGAEFSSEVYEKQRELLTKQADAEIDAVNRSTMSAEEKAARIKAIEQQLNDDLIANKREEMAEEAEVEHLKTQNALTEREMEAEATLNNIKAGLQARREAAAELKRIRDERLDDEENALTEAYQRGEMKYEEYQAGLLEIERERIANEIADEEEKAAQIKELQNEILSFVSDMASEIFGAISDHIQQQLDDLDEYYTTDAEEAKEDANKKYLSEKEMEDKKLALKRKAAAVEKAEAAFNIAMNTAMAIMRIWADVPKVDFGATTIAMTAFAAALGATQLAMVLAKPLPKYAKGRKRGKGEYAMVGERGAELMWIPDNASIVPHHKVNKPETWGDYGVPTPYIPAQPDIEREIMQSIIMQHIGFADFDYERMGLSVAKHIPEQKAVYVTVDRNGIGVSEGGDTHTYLNRKYQGAWN